MGESQSQQERTWAMLCHLLAFAGFVVPFGNIIGPLVIWLMKKQESALVADQGLESLNFQISVTIYAAIGVVLTFVAIGIPVLVALGVFEVVIVVIASVRANNGERYRYPLNLRLVKV